jgi:hypothetical protein
VGEKRNAYRILVGKSEGNLDIGERLILRSILEIGWGDMDWTDLAQDREEWRALVNTVMNVRSP